MSSNVSFLQELLGSIADRGRQLLPSALVGARREGVEELAVALLSGRGEASGVAIARELIDRYRTLTGEQRLAFFRFLATRFKPDGEAVLRAATAHIAAPSDASLMTLQRAVESPRQELFRRLNLAPGATAEIVAMRSDLLRAPKTEPGFAAVDSDLQHLLYSWFNRGFLVLRRIDWQTPAAILEKIIRYEAVHAIQGWDDLRRRLDPTDRRCFAFFHPSLIDEPLIFVEVALTAGTPDSIQSLLREQQKPNDGVHVPTTAVFYSISNCQEGLRGISFGNFLIKQVAEELAREVPTLRTFVTLSPVPTFARWLDRALAARSDDILPAADADALKALRDPRWLETADEGASIRPALLGAAAHYFLRAKSADGRPVDPVARFHLGNGARLERINWLGDVSEKGLREAHGLMVNYLYDLDAIETNHEAYENQGAIAAAKSVRSLLRTAEKPRAATKLLTAARPAIGKA
ncbi:MAG: malonyl-CoA decarboxylase family protein [Hyphomicrobiales bacterium]|nr:malonyl-CoA decarboxylase family protein [Hyphomicrobiales bacterium]